jgi:hypothetical protein
MSERKTITVYVVQQVHWEYNDEDYTRVDEMNAPLRTFLDRARAEAHRREREQQSPGFDPIHYSGWAYEAWTTLPQEEFVARLRAVGLDPTDEEVQASTHGYHPSGGPDPPEDYCTWLYNTVTFGALSEEQQEAVREAFDRVRQFDVVPITIELEE